MTIVKILGIGSPFGDDQVGWLIIEMIKQKKEFSKYFPGFLQMQSLDRPGLSLLRYLREATAVILIDAIKSGAKLGKIYQFENPQIKNDASFFSTHGIGVIETLQLGNLLHELPSLILLYGIEVHKINYENTISPPIKKAAIRLTEMIIDKVHWLYLHNTKTSL